MPDADTPLAREGWEGGAGGAPSQKTCRRRRRSNPSRKEDSMHRRLPALLAALVAAVLVVPGSVLGARVTVRVEGKTQTIFAPTPRAVDAANALEALDRASLAGEFFYHVTTASFGRYVDQIGLYPASGTAGWVFKVNGASPPVGADSVELKDGDAVLWYWAQFGVAPGGP